MSFLETGKDRIKWAAPARSVRRDPGCSQCGRTLEMNAAGKFDLSGKCQECVNPMVEDFEDFEDLAD
jgi:ribosomal protein S27E